MDYFVYMTTKGQTVESSAVANGNYKHCQAVASRLNKQKDKHRDIEWKVRQCVS